MNIRRRPLLVVMCGLPGSGKSTLSRALARELGVLRWDKDELRHLLFPPHAVAHDRYLNDFCMELLHSAARHVVVGASSRISTIILDGRPFLEAHQRSRARVIAREASADIVFVLCTASLDVLRRRVAADAHVASDRDASLVDRLAAAADRPDGEEINVDTAELTEEIAVAHCLRELRRRGYFEPV